MAVILMIGFTIRIWGIFAYDIPESAARVVSQALQYGTGSFLLPTAFWYPTAYSLMLFVIYSIYFLLGYLTGYFQTTSDFAVLYFSDFLTFFIIGRLITVLLGVLTIYVVYKLAKKIHNPILGIVASIFLGFNFVHIQFSQVVKLDVPSTLFILLSFYYCYLLLEDRRLKYYIFSGIFAGLAAATKHPAGIFIFVLVFSHLLTIKNMKDIVNRAFLTSIACYIVTFFIFSPHYIFHPEKLFSWISYLALERPDYKTFTMLAYDYDVQNTYGVFFLKYLPSAMGPIFAVLTLPSIIYLAFKRTRKDVLLISFPIIFFIIVGFQANTFPRYWVPIYPFLSIIVAIFIINMLKIVLKKSEYRVFILAGITLTIIIFPAFSAMRYNYQISQKDTREIAKEWVEKNIHENTKLAMEIYGPALNETVESFRDSRMRSSHEYLIELYDPQTLDKGSITEGKYVLMAIQRHPEWKKYYIYSDFTLAHKTLEYYREQGYKYLIVNSYQYARFMRLPEFDKYGDFYRELFETQTLLKEFPSNPVDRPGPIIRIYTIS